MKIKFPKIELPAVHLNPKVSHWLHHAHAPVHALYFAMVAVEAGHWYGLAAGALFLLTVTDAFDGGAA